MNRHYECTESWSDPDDFQQILEDRLQQLLERLHGTEVIRVLIAEDSPPGLVRAVMKELYLEIVSYQPDVVESAIAIIGQMPRTINPREIRSMLLHQAEEFHHGEMALRDYMALGGDENYALSRPKSPASLAAAGVWWLLARERRPFAYLGAVTLFECLTSLITGTMKGLLRERGMPEDAMEFIDFHAVVDIGHCKLMKHLVKQALTKVPEAGPEILYGMECFMQVYPIPVWEEALRRGRAAYGAETGHTKIRNLNQVSTDHVQ